MWSRSVDWQRVEDRLKDYWSRLPKAVRVLSGWSQSRRFSELTYVREELLGSYKARKYLTLLPWLKAQGFGRVRISGSSHSGNVVQLALLLRESGIEPVYVHEGRGGPPAGNSLLAQLAYGADFGAEDPKEVDFVIPEGGSHFSALAGSLGLAGSLVERALEARRWTEKIFIDSGTGFSAVALLMGLGYLGLRARVCIVSMTGQTEQDFRELATKFSDEHERLLGCAPKLAEFQVEIPSVGPSFGSVPAASLGEVQSFAKDEAILVDPIYTAKLSLFYRQNRNPKEPALMFVSGGVRELLCFQGPLRKWLELRNQKAPGPAP
jgi:1-aminocyclopropane-1-carboxylate deaminase/D-cysteine desulfhydrase-like pyridoxal-dependent ACC family enzyme